MAITLKEVAEGWMGDVGGPLVWRSFDVVGPSSYSVGGEVCATSDLKVSKVLLVIGAHANGNLIDYDFTNSKLKFRYMNHTHTENTAGAYAQNAVTAAPNAINGFSERGGTTNLSASTIRIFVIGTAP